MARNAWVTFARLSSLAFSFAVTMGVSLLLGFWGGRWLDRRLGTEPWFMIGGILLGVGLAFKSILDELEALSKEGKGRDGDRER